MAAGHIGGVDWRNAGDRSVGASVHSPEPRDSYRGGASRRSAHGRQEVPWRRVNPNRDPSSGGPLPLCRPLRDARRRAKYLAALKQVRAKGIAPELTGTIAASGQRSVDETLVGIFWGYDGATALGIPPRLYNQIVRQVAMAQGNTPDKNGRLFALDNAAMGDAGILAWKENTSTISGARWSGSGSTTHRWGRRESPRTPSTTYVTRSGSPWARRPATRRQRTSRRLSPPTRRGHATFGASALHITRLFYGIKPGDCSADKLFTDPSTKNHGSGTPKKP